MLTTTVYVAAPWIHGGDALEAKRKLEEAGIRVTSRWLRRVKGNVDPSYNYMKDSSYTPEDGEREAEMDISDVMVADYVVVLNSAKSEGKAVEQGLAIAYGIPIILVGKGSNTFHYLSKVVTIVGSVEEAINLIKREAKCDSSNE